MIKRTPLKAEPKRGKYRAIDLYSGVGGWSLGLKMAGIDVVASYEWWKKASLTNHRNNGHEAIPGDIRELKLEDLPEDIDIVVGSPPCTQFSFANRGGNGDIEDGLKDIAKFLEIVDHLEPTFWAMENVPRVAGILEERLAVDGPFAKYRHLRPIISTVDMAEWGLPQRRKRCIVGNFDHELLRSYRNRLKPRTLGEVVESLSLARVKDSIYDIRMASNRLQDHIPEDFLSPEEVRINCENKSYHPIYNNMEFPDLLGRPGRTITATCTRVSRESIVIASPDDPKKFRRLSVRERACLQGFPISYQFFGDSYAEKLKMIGNAIPPLFTFYVAQAILGIDKADLISPKEGYKAFEPCTLKPPFTRPDTAGANYPPNRRFRSAIPQLRFKSGVRFDLANQFFGDSVEWSVGFFFGNSKDIQRISLNKEVLDELLLETGITAQRVKEGLDQLEFDLYCTNAGDLQDEWTHARDGGGPFALVDKLGEVASVVADELSADELLAVKTLKTFLRDRGNPPGTEKLLRYATRVLAGLIVGSAANVCLESDLFNRRRVRIQTAS